MSLPPTPSAANTIFDEKHCHTAYFTSQPTWGGILVTARGEIDSVNSEPFAAFALNRATAGRRLRVDLSRITFFGVDGVAALHTIHADCAARGIRWTIMPGPAALRVLRICDRAGVLPVIAGTTTPASLQLVTQPAQSSRQ
jgi:anti-anti-sigma regulatory factor